MVKSTKEGLDLCVIEKERGETLSKFGESLVGKETTKFEHMNDEKKIEK